MEVDELPMQPHSTTSGSEGGDLLDQQLQLHQQQQQQNGHENGIATKACGEVDGEVEAQQPMSDDQQQQQQQQQQPPCQQFRMHIREGGVDMWLLNSEVWELLHPFGHEMLINTSGRYMRPDVRVEVRGLHPDKMYHLRVRIAAISPIKMSFRRGRWEYSTNEAAADISVTHEHPDSPRSGQFWFESFIIFDAIKLYSTSAGEAPSAGSDGSRLVLEPRRKYQIIIELEEAVSGELFTFEFEQLQFISVTAWHSAAVKNFKVKPHQYANPTRTRPVDEVDAALGARAVPPTFQVLDERGHVVRDALNPHAVNILCKPPQAHGSARVHKLGIIHDAGISSNGGGDDDIPAPVLSAPSGHETQRALRLLHEPSTPGLDDDDDDDANKMS